MNNLHLLCLLVSLSLLLTSALSTTKSGQEDESATAYAVFDENNEEFVIVNNEPPRDKYVAGAKFANSINQTGYVFFRSVTCESYFTSSRMQRVVLLTIKLQMG